MKPTLTEQDFIDAAARMGVEVAAIKAVAEVEAPRGGFDGDRPVILFEGHRFHRYTGGRFDQSHPTISYPKWTRKFYGKNQNEEWDRRATAYRLDPVAAMLSTSYGKFQIMGFNYAQAGFRSLLVFDEAMWESEGAQLQAFVAFLENSGLTDELREHRWADFARLYNGPLYRENRYDEKLAAAYAKFSV